ncbi:hypothetical protein KY285_036348 [Solanum tuberosum]|nr:hypothetical protein KY285_036348 [Solanum tuberosum]
MELSRPMNDLLKNGNFHWDPTASTTFEHLKQAITSAHVLALPDFSKGFIVETDDSGNGIGVVLAQGTNLIAFFSQGLSYRCKSLFLYERELLAVVSTVQKWRLYLLRRHFVIKTDHHSPMFLLHQRITTHS